MGSSKKADTEESSDGVGASDPFETLLRDAAQAPPVDPATLRPELRVGQQLGRFVLRRVIGTGGMGVVYEAEDLQLHRRVAVKVLRPTLDRERLVREARTAAANSHPNIVTVHEVGTADDGTAFIAMEYVEGTTLRTALRAGSWPSARIWHVARGVARGLAAAHGAGVVHHDLKPDNVMVTAAGGVKLLDFGVANLRAAFAEDTGAGTRGYIAPERRPGAVSDARSDVHSFGIILGELLDATPRPPRALRAVESRCRREAPHERYADGAAVARELDRLLDRRRRMSLFGAVLISGLVSVVGYAALQRASRASTTTPLPLVERRLTHEPAENALIDVALSPVGSALAYVDGDGVHVVESAGAEPRHLRVPGPGAPYVLSWYPDGRALLVLNMVPDQAPVRIWRVPLEGVPTALGEERWSRVELSPAMAAIAFIDEAGAGWRSREGSEGGRLVHARSGERVLDLAWSRDGARVAWIVARLAPTPDARLEWCDVKPACRPRLLARSPRLLLENGSTGVAFGPRGILFLGEDDRVRRRIVLWEQPLDDGAPAVERFAWTDAIPLRLSVSRSGQIGFLRQEMQTDVYVAALRGRPVALGAPRRLTRGPGHERPSGWTPAGDAVLYTSDSSGTPGAFQHRLDSEQPSVLVTAEGDVTWPISLEDGTLLFWQSKNASSAAPELMSRRAQQTRSVTRAGEDRLASVPSFGPLGTWVRCAADAARCAVGEVHDGRLHVRTFAPGGGPLSDAVELPYAALGAGRWDVSPDGTRYALPGAPGELRVFSEQGALVEQRTTDPRCHIQYVTFAPGLPGRLFFTAHCGPPIPYKLFVSDPDSPPRVLFESGHAWLGHPVPAPDGKRLAFGLRAYDTDAWMLTHGSAPNATAPRDMAP